MRVLCLAAIFAAGCCEDGECPEDTDDTSDDTDEPSGCPEGMEPTTTASLAAGELTFDGVSWFFDFDPAREVQGRPSACVRTDGTGVDFLTTVGDDPFARIAMTAPATGTWTLNDPAIGFAVESFGDPPVIFSVGDFQTGTLDVGAVGATFRASAVGSAAAGGHTLGLNLTAEAQP